MQPVLSNALYHQPSAVAAAGAFGASNGAALSFAPAALAANQPVSGGSGGHHPLVTTSPNATINSINYFHHPHFPNVYAQPPTNLVSPKTEKGDENNKKGESDDKTDKTAGDSKQANTKKGADKKQGHYHRPIPNTAPPLIQQGMYHLPYRVLKNEACISLHFEVIWGFYSNALYGHHFMPPYGYAHHPPFYTAHPAYQAAHLSPAAAVPTSLATASTSQALTATSTAKF